MAGLGPHCLGRRGGPRPCEDRAPTPSRSFCRWISARRSASVSCTPRVSNTRLNSACTPFYIGVIDPRASRSMHVACYLGHGVVACLINLVKQPKKLRCWVVVGQDSLLSLLLDQILDFGDRRVLGQLCTMVLPLFPLAVQPNHGLVWLWCPAHKVRHKLVHINASPTGAAGGLGQDSLQLLRCEVHSHPRIRGPNELLTREVPRVNTAVHLAHHMHQLPAPLLVLLLQLQLEQRFHAFGWVPANVTPPATRVNKHAVLQRAVVVYLAVRLPAPVGGSIVNFLRGTGASLPIPSQSRLKSYSRLVRLVCVATHPANCKLTRPNTLCRNSRQSTVPVRFTSNLSNRSLASRALSGIPMSRNARVNDCRLTWSWPWKKWLQAPAPREVAATSAASAAVVQPRT